MKPIHVIATLIVSAFLFSCNKSTGILSIKVPVIDISDSTNTISLPDSLIINPSNLLAIGDYIVMSNNNTDYVLTIINRVNSKIQYLQRKGRGPEELLNVNQIGIYPDSTNSAFYIHDDLKSCIFVYQLDNEQFTLSKIVEIDKFNLIALDTNIIVGVPSVETGRYMVSKYDKTVMKFGDYSEYESSKTPVDNTLSTGYAVLNNNSHRFAWFSLYGESLNIFDYSDLESISELKKAFYNKPIFDNNALKTQGVAILYPETGLGFTALTNSKEFIYALHSGKTINDFIGMQGSALYGNNIAVFNWSGDYIKRLQSKSPIVSISYNNSNNRLYILRLTDDLKYEIISLNTI